MFSLYLENISSLLHCNCRCILKLMIITDILQWIWDHIDPMTWQNVQIQTGNLKIPTYVESYWAGKMPVCTLWNIFFRKILNNHFKASFKFSFVPLWELPHCLLHYIILNVTNCYNVLPSIWHTGSIVCRSQNCVRNLGLCDHGAK